MRTWYLRIVDTSNGYAASSFENGYMVEGMEVEFDGSEHHVSDFDSWGTFENVSDAVERLDSVVQNYHKAQHWDGFAQWLFDGSLVTEGN